MVNNIIDGRDGRFCFLNVFVSMIGSSLWPSSDAGHYGLGAA